MLTHCPSQMCWLLAHVRHAFRESSQPTWAVLRRLVARGIAPTGLESPPLQRRSPGLQVPVQAAFRHRYSQVVSLFQRPSEPHERTVRPEHSRAPGGTPRSRHPGRCRRSRHRCATCQMPPVLQVSAFPLLQRRAPGLQFPVQLPLLQMNWQAEPLFAQLPCGRTPAAAGGAAAGARLALAGAGGVSRAYELAACPGSQVPIGLQVSGMSPRQRFRPGMHEPAQEPLEQRFWQGVSAVHCPASLQVSGTRCCLDCSVSRRACRFRYSHPCPSRRTRRPSPGPTAPPGLHSPASGWPHSACRPACTSRCTRRPSRSDGQVSFMAHIPPSPHCSTTWPSSGSRRPRSGCPVDILGAPVGASTEPWPPAPPVTVSPPEPEAPPGIQAGGPRTRRAGPTLS